MKKLLFKPSAECTIGIELELQIINSITGNLISRAKDLIRNIRYSSYSQWIKPEITQSMIELNSSIHHSAADMLDDLLAMKTFLKGESQRLNVQFSGGGTHPLQMWKNLKIFPTMRFKYLSRRYGYLAKRFTVFGQHIHIGCVSADDAIYLTQALARYVPQFIVLTASSPFYQGVNTGYDSSRINVVTSFPTSGYMPFMQNWEEFSHYFHKLCTLGIIKSIKDVYWDIRPKPEYGTIEIRVCDVPLTLKKAVNVAAYAQTLARYLLHERPEALTPYDPMLYNYNRYQASRYGFEGDFINPYTSEHVSIGKDILTTITNIQSYTNDLNNTDFIKIIKKDVIDNKNDARWLRDTYAETQSLKKVIFAQAALWMNE